MADATAAMIHAVQFGGAMEFGGAIRDLSIFVRDYTAGCRLSCVIRRYTIEERKEKKLCHGHLRPDLRNIIYYIYYHIYYILSYL